MFTFFNILKSFLSNRSFVVKFQSGQSKLYPILAGVPQGSVLAPILYTLFTSDIPQSQDTTLATFADDTAILSVHNDPIQASQQLQQHLDLIQHWQQKWRLRTNETKSTHVTFSLRHGNSPNIYFNNVQIPHTDTAKYLGLHLDRRLNWKTHIQSKRKQLDIKFKQFFWLLGRKSKLSLQNKVLIYKSVIKPIWSYGIQLWGTSTESNIQIVQRFQSKALRTLTSAPWYITNKNIHRDLNIPTVKEEISKFCHKYEKRLESHQNHLAINLLDNGGAVRRLKRKHPTDLFNIN